MLNNYGLLCIVLYSNDNPLVSSLLDLIVICRLKRFIFKVSGDNN